MKKIAYIIGLMLGTVTAGYGQTVLLASTDKIAAVSLLEEDMIVFNKKEKQGQFIYTTQHGSTGEPQKPAILNTGQINTLIGSKANGREVYVYHKNGRKKENIGVYTLQNGSFQKTGELPLPRMRNHSQNLGMHLTEDQKTLYIAAELGSTQGYDDLYVSEWKGSAWSKPENLGKQVNTKEVEFAPFVANDSLFFSRQQGETAYIYGAPISNGKVAAEPVQIKSVVNSLTNFNSYFKKSGIGTTWVSANAGEHPTYTAYLLESEKPVETVAGPLAKVEEPVEKEQVHVAKVAATPSLVLFNGFNRVHLELGELATLSKFLRQQPAGASFMVRGYSDGYGEPSVRQRVSQQRAQHVKQYISRYFADKDFQVQIESEVLQEKGKPHRKTELYLVQ